MDDELEAAVEAVRAGELVVYPTETVYGLGTDALSTEAIDRVFAAKSRPHDRPLSLAVPTVEAAAAYVDVTDRVRACMSAFLPGPVTVVCRKTETVPDRLTAGLERVGVRVPDHPVANRLLRRVSPVTATSANVSGRSGVRTPDDLDASVRAAIAVVLDGGRTPGGASTVVDPDRGVVHRRGQQADEVDAWLDEQYR